MPGSSKPSGSFFSRLTRSIRSDQSKADGLTQASSQSSSAWGSSAQQNPSNLGSDWPAWEPLIFQPIKEILIKVPNWFIGQIKEDTKAEVRLDAYGTIPDMQILTPTSTFIGRVAGHLGSGMDSEQPPCHSDHISYFKANHPRCIGRFN